MSLHPEIFNREQLRDLPEKVAAGLGIEDTVELLLRRKVEGPVIQRALTHLFALELKDTKELIYNQLGGTELLEELAETAREAFKATLSSPMYSDVATLASNQGRMVGTEGHRFAKEYLSQRMQQLGLEFYDGSSFELPYSCGSDQLVNLVGRIPGSNPSLPALLVVAHYDTCGPLPGADDNAAAVSILLDAVPDLQASKLEHDVVVAFFDGEEPPHFLQESMGSIHFYKHQRKEEIHAGIVLDLVGHATAVPGRESLLFVTGLDSHPELVSVAGSGKMNEQVSVAPVPSELVGSMSDYHILAENNVPYLFLTCGQWKYYHTAEDTVDKLDFGKMDGVRDYLVQSVVRMDSAKLPSESRKERPDPLIYSDLVQVFSEELTKRGINLSHPIETTQALAAIAREYGLI